MVCAILVPLPGMEPPPPAVEAQISFFLSFLKLCIYFVALGLGCCMQAFSSCGEEGLLSCCGVWWRLLLWSTGSRAHKPSCSESREILIPEPGIKPVSPHWQVHSYPLCH